MIQHMLLCSGQYHQNSRDIGFQDIGFIWERHQPLTDWRLLEQPVVWICLSLVFTRKENIQHGMRVKLPFACIRCATAAEKRSGPKE
jgi:hypothetical protein